MEHTGGTTGFSGSGDTEVSPDGPLAAPPDPEDSQAVDEQLTAILEAIRSWDWRAGIFADDGTLKQATEPTGRHVSRLDPAPDPLSSLSGLFVEPSIDAIKSHASDGAESFPTTDPRPLIEDPLEAKWAPSGNGANGPTKDVSTSQDPAPPPQAPPSWIPIVAASAPPPPSGSPSTSPGPFATEAPTPPPPSSLADTSPVEIIPPPPAPIFPALLNPEPTIATAEPASAEVESESHVPEPESATVESESHVTEPTVGTGEPENDVIESTIATAETGSHVAEPTIIATAETESDVAEPATAAAGAVPVGALATSLKPDPPRARFAEGPTPPRWWVKYIMWLGTAVIVVIIVAIIRSNSPPSTSSPFGSLSNGTSTTIHVSNAVLTEFTTISKSLNTANIEATKALANGSSQTTAQVATEVAPYLTALDTFNFDLHLMTWPRAMRVPSQDLVLRTKSLATFVVSEDSTNAASLSSWFTQFHALAQQTQAADNVVRRDIGLPTTTNYP